jgi:hypothetical protein
MSENNIDFDKVIELLIGEGSLKGKDLIPNRTPTHGSCCTCPICGQYYDDCVCLHNELLTKLLALRK